jgi:hypothetical protein
MIFSIRAASFTAPPTSRLALSEERVAQFSTQRQNFENLLIITPENEFCILFSFIFIISFKVFSPIPLGSR